MNKDSSPSDQSKPKAYTVSSKPRTPKTVSFTVPQVSRPHVEHFKNSRIKHALLAVAFIGVAVLSGFGGAWLQDQKGSEINSSSLSTEKKIVTSQSQLISQIAKTVGPSVVSVNVNITTASSGDDTASLFGFAQPQQSQQAAGTGIIISSNGLIVTNRHVVPVGTTKVSVTLSDGTELKDVSVIGRTAETDVLDVAFLKINDAKGHTLPAAKLGNSTEVQVGDDAIAIGNALGQFQNTVTSGIISGYGRSVQASDSSGSASAENLDNLFQTDAAINEGNSGGPLVNLNGQVIGINTAIAGNAQNIGFAIPINDVRGLINQVLKSGKFARPYLGVRYVMLTPDVANQYGLSVNNGAYIAPTQDPTNPSVVVGSPAEASGLKERDIIVEVNGKKIDQQHSLVSQLGQYQPGDKVKLTVIRGGKTIHLTATIGSVPTT